MSVLDLLLWTPVVGPLLWLAAKMVAVWFVTVFVAVGLPILIAIIAELLRIGHEADE